jgi:hypothetical protein
VLLKKAAIAKAQVYHPGADDASVRPGGSAVFSDGPGREIRCNRRIGSIVRLSILQIARPFGEKASDIPVECRRAQKDLGVTRPAHALIPLRAVSGNIHEIAFLTPNDVVL